MEQKIRAFIAIDFPDEVVKEVARIQELVGKRKFTGKLIELGNLHLTLKFLGEISDEKLEEVKEKLREIKIDKFEAKLGEVGTFNFKGMPRIVWIKIAGKGVFDLQKEIDKVLEGLFNKEERFMSHLTIARVKYVKDKETFKEHIKNLNVKPLKFYVEDFKLMKSDLQISGPVYSVLEKYKFIPGDS